MLLILGSDIGHTHSDSPLLLLPLRGRLKHWNCRTMASFEKVCLVWPQWAVTHKLGVVLGHWCRIVL